jgi:flagellar basal-body rod protein FlgB
MELTEATIIQALNLSQRAEWVVANNLANAETPGYRARVLSFRQALARAVTQGPDAVSAVEGTLATLPGRVQANGNNVSVTQQMTFLAQDQLYYNTAVAAFNHWATAIKAVAEGKAL